MSTLVTWTPYGLGVRDAELIADPDAEFDSAGVIVGGDGALDTHDGDTSYVEVSGRDQVVSFQLSPDRSPPFGDLLALWWTATFRSIVEPTFSSAYSIYAAGPEIRGTYGDENAPTYPGAYTTVEWFHLTPDYNIDAQDFLQAALDQPGAVFGVQGPFGGATRVTFLRMYSLHAGSSHLRQRNRDTIRARNRPSRQRGLRARGYY